MLERFYRRLAGLCIAGLVLIALSMCLAAAPVEADFQKYVPACEVKVARKGGDVLRVEWNGGEGQRCAAEINLAEGKPLLKSLEIAPQGGEFAAITNDVQVRFDVIIGTRGIGERGEGDGPYVFFDKVDTRPYKRHTAEIVPDAVKVVSDGAARARIILSRMSAGSFSGSLNLNFYSGSPFVHLDATMAPDEPKVAYLYDVLLGGNFPEVTYRSNSTDHFVSERPAGNLAARKVRNRTIMAQFPRGTLAVFPPPHAYIYPMDLSDNFGFVQVGREGGMDLLGLKSQPRGDNRFRPWIDAPAGRTQHMSAFLLLSPTPAAQTLDRVGRYTHGDSFKEIPGYVTFANHFHAALTVTDGTENPENFKKTMMALNVKTVEVAEFHGDGHASDTGTTRLDELKKMFEVCRKYSVPGAFTIIPGEEANTGFPGHSMYFFPKPVYLTLKKERGQPYKENLPEYGEVFHVGSQQDMVNVLRDNGGLVWTSHPRIKASRNQPDSLFNTAAFKDDAVFSGGDWKAMPLDLSEDRLGVRSLKLLDDMNQLGRRKRILGEVDVFKMDPSHELYAHMNINYVKADGVPPATDWAPIHSAIRDFRYFTTTGEVLIHSWSVSAARDQITAEIEWTFPMAFAEVIWGDGKEVKRATFPLRDTRELADKVQRFSWPVDLTGAKWVRLEAWDIARNGAFTPTAWQ